MTRTRTFGVLAVGLGAVALVGVALAPACRGAPLHPNVLVVVWDTVRADRMSLYGHERPTTPRLDAFAKKAAVYERAISPGEWTIPSHASMFTGLPVASHGATNKWMWLDAHHVTLAEHFGANGYRTFAWSSNPTLGDHTNVLQGFQTIEYSYSPDNIARATAATEAKLIPNDASGELSPAWKPPPGFKEWSRMIPKDAAPVAVEELLAWMDAGEADDQPFFAFVNLLEAHVPRIPSMEARKAVVGDDVIARQLAVDASFFRLMSALEGKTLIPPEDRSTFASIYDAALWDLDHATGKLIDELRARGRLDDTIVVVTSDHGESFGEFGMYEHRWDLHDPLVHVPLVVHYPPAVAPGRLTKPVSTSHLFGTLTALAGIAPPEVSHPLPVLGVLDQVFAELVVPGVRDGQIIKAYKDLDPERWQRRYQAVYQENLKLLRAIPGGDELFDVVADPRERVDISRFRADEADHLRELLDAWKAERPVYDPSKRAADDRPRKPGAAGDGVAEQLRTLGYTTEEEEPVEKPKAKANKAKTKAKTP